MCTKAGHHLDFIDFFFFAGVRTAIKLGGVMKEHPGGEEEDRIPALISAVHPCSEINIFFIFWCANHLSKISADNGRRSSTYVCLEVGVLIIFFIYFFFGIIFW